MRVKLPGVKEESSEDAVELVGRLVVHKRQHAAHVSQAAHLIFFTEIPMCVTIKEKLNDKIVYALYFISEAQIQSLLK